jgi:hypothetical protein
MSMYLYSQTYIYKHTVHFDKYITSPLVIVAEGMFRTSFKKAQYLPGRSHIHRERSDHGISVAILVLWNKLCILVLYIHHLIP